MPAISLVAAEEQLTSPAHGLDWGNTLGLGRRGLHPGSANLSRQRVTRNRPSGRRQDGYEINNRCIPSAS